MSAHPACPFCGAAVSADARYCDRCGTPLTPADTPTPPRSRARSARRVAVWVFVVVLLLVFGGGTLGGYRYQAGNWPVFTVAGRTVEPAVSSVTPPPDPAVSKYLRSVVSINVRGDRGNLTGSGFLIDNAGHVATVAHAVEGATCATVFDDDGRAHAGAIVGRDRNRDIALLSVPTLASWPSHLEFGASAGLQVKAPVYVLGSPKGASNPVPLAATVSKLGVQQTTDDGHYYARLIAFEGATVREGTSGGPLVEKADGRVIGLVAVASAAPIAYAIPADDVAGQLHEWAALPAPSCSAGPAANRTVPVTLAAIVPRSGAYGVEGADLADGAGLALKDLSPALAAVGYDVSLKTLDDQGLPDTAREKALAAAYDPKVIGVVGSLESKATFAIADALKPSSLVVVSPTAGADDLTAQGWSHFNRLVANVRREEQGAARFAREKLKASAVFLIDDGTPDAAAQLQAFRYAAQTISLPLAGELRLAPHWDYAEVKQQLVAAKADAVYYAGQSPSALMLVQAMRNDGLMMPILGGEALLDPRFEQLTDVNDRGIYFTRLTAEPTEPFKRYFESELKKPTRYGAYGYDAAAIILNALLRYGETHPAQIPSRAVLAQMVRETNGYSGWATWATFDRTGENLWSWVYLYEWRQGVPELRDGLK